MWTTEKRRLKRFEMFFPFPPLNPAYIGINRQNYLLETIKAEAGIQSGPAVFQRPTLLSTSTDHSTKEHRPEEMGDHAGLKARDTWSSHTLAEGLQRVPHAMGLEGLDHVHLRAEHAYLSC